MTKVAITGPATGTGTYTLRAPDTASTLDFELPTVGTHLASAQADGMPLGTGGVAIIESGSNSNGEYTKFADGTMVCFHAKSAVGNVNIARGNIYWTGSADWVFPITFAGSPRVSVSEQSGVGECWGGLGSSATNVTGTSFALYRAFPVNGNPGASLIAIGRWK